MNGFIKRTLAAVCVGGLAVFSGCVGEKHHLCDCYDNCWLARNSYQAGSSVNATFGAQVNNGHVLDQTVFSYDFEGGTDKLTPGGQLHLVYLARRRPQPDTHLYLQTAQDVVYDAAAPDKYAQGRVDLNNKRIEAIQRFLNAETAGRPVAFEVTVHDAPTPGESAIPINSAVVQHYGNFRGALTAGTVGTGPSGGPQTGQSTGGGQTGGGTGR